MTLDEGVEGPRNDTWKRSPPSEERWVEKRWVETHSVEWRHIAREWARNRARDRTEQSGAGARDPTGSHARVGIPLVGIPLVGIPLIGINPRVWIPRAWIPRAWIPRLWVGAAPTRTRPSPVALCVTRHEHDVCLLFEARKPQGCAERQAALRRARPGGDHHAEGCASNVHVRT